MTYWTLILSLFSITILMLEFTEIQPILSSIGQLIIYPILGLIVGTALFYSSKKDAD